MSTEQTLINHVVKDRIAVLTLNDPPANTYSYDMMQQLDRAILNARMDEAGTPFCLTIDGDSLKNNDVTVRVRDTAQQERVGTSQLQNYLAEKLG